jgi:hypothetical protein
MLLISGKLQVAEGKQAANIRSLQEKVADLSSTNAKLAKELEELKALYETRSSELMMSRLQLANEADKHADAKSEDAQMRAKAEAELKETQNALAVLVESSKKLKQSLAASSKAAADYYTDVEQKAAKDKYKALETILAEEIEWVRLAEAKEAEAAAKSVEYRNAAKRQEEELESLERQRYAARMRLRIVQEKEAKRLAREDSEKEMWGQEEVGTTLPHFLVQRLSSLICWGCLGHSSS